MNVDFIDKQELQTLINERNKPCVSIYLPMVRVGPDVRGNRIQLKDALKEVEEQLREDGWDTPDINEFLAEPRLVVDENYAFWQQQSNGLAVFISPDTFAMYRLPLDFEPLTIVSDHIHVKPLLPLYSDDGRFYILALSQNKVRLFQGTHYQINEMELEHAPKSMADALAYDDPEEQLQYHMSTSGAGTKPGAVHHGHDPQTDEEEERLRRYLEQVRDGIREQLEGAEGPIVLAAVEYLHPIYKKVDSSPHLVEKGINGNPDDLSAQELHEKAWDIVHPLFEKAKKDAINRYHELSATEKVSDALEQIVPVAYQGRVDTLFVAWDNEEWGRYDPDKDRLELHDERENGDEDLLDFAAVQTLAYGGTVYAVDASEVPGSSPIAAIFRF